MCLLLRLLVTHSQTYMHTYDCVFISNVHGFVFSGSALLNCAVCNYPMEWSAWKCDVNCNVVSQADYGSTINYTALLQRLEAVEKVEARLHAVEAWKVGTF